MDGEVASSVSPAIAVVLYFIFGFRGRLYADWKGLEVIAGLYCLRQLAMRDDVDLNKVGLRKVDEPYPASNAKRNFKVPFFPDHHVRNTAWINGPMAPFADAVAPYLLVLSKYSLTSKREITVDLVSELKKLGVTKDATELQHAFVSALYWTWELNQIFQEPQDTSDDAVPPPNFANLLLRPECLFLTDGFVRGDLPHLRFQIKGNKVYSEFPSDIIQSESCQSFDLMKDAFSKEVRVVFFDECSSVGDEEHREHHYFAKQYCSINRRANFKQVD